MDLTIPTIAMICHEANRAWCASIGDTSQVPWNEAPEWQQESAIRGVEFAYENPNLTAEAQHDNWVSDKLADGWVHGPIKCPSTKTHPCIVPYSALPEEQKVKDILFRAIVKALLPVHEDACRSAGQIP